MANDLDNLADKTFKEKIRLFHDIRKQKNQFLKQNEKPIHLFKLKLSFYFLTLLKGSSNIVGFALSYRLMLGTKNVLAAAWGMTYFSLVIDAFNFFRTPLLILLSKLAGEDKKLTVSKTAKWLYSTCVLTLGILSIMLPSISTFILIALMVIAIVDAIVLLSKVCFARYEEKSNLAKSQRYYPNLIKELLILEAKIENLETEEEIQDLDSNLVDYQRKITKLQKIVYQYVNAKRRLEKNDSIRLTDKIVILFLSILGLAASTLVLIIPPLGAVLFSFTSAIAVTFLLSRLVMEIYWPKKLALETDLMFGHEDLNQAIPLDRIHLSPRKPNIAAEQTDYFYSEESGNSSYSKLFPIKTEQRRSRKTEPELNMFDQEDYAYRKESAPTLFF